MAGTPVNLAALLLSALSLIVVSLVGWHSWHLGREMVKLTRESADATRRSAEASQSAAEATERSVSATEEAATASMRAAKLVEDDARRRRIEAALDVVVEMRALFNEQIEVGAPDLGLLARLAMSRRLEARMAALERYDELAKTRSLVIEARVWSNTLIEQAITELTCLLRSPAPPLAQP
ncbi:MAG: hypothetical protein ACYCV7_07430 [Acidimicrobiales bacterium]